jgi:serine/threonine protein kinase
LKPSNVLVVEQDNKAVPKIIDFGLAKATAQRLTDKTMFTELGVMIGTPEYMSPEQADQREQNIDTRTDVYSLGVIFYQLLVGVLPFEAKALRAAGLEAILRVIREQEPPKPSTRIRSMGPASADSAEKRKEEPRSFARHLRGELDLDHHEGAGEGSRPALRIAGGTRCGYRAPSAQRAGAGAYAQRRISRQQVCTMAWFRCRSGCFSRAAVDWIRGGDDRASPAHR